MNKPISNLQELIRTMEPVLNEGTYVFSSIPHGSDLGDLEPVATFREKEGITVIVEKDVAERHHLPVLFNAAWITLLVHSDLQSVGLTAAFSNVLGKANISCNVIAGAFHDHIFVPVDLAHQAIEILCKLQQDS